MISLARRFVRASPSVAVQESSGIKPVVINDDDAIVEEKVLQFYLKGIFKEDDLIASVLRLLSADVYRWSLAKIDSFIADALSKTDDRKAANRKIKEAFRFHQEESQANRRSYRPTGRENECAVFWPNPTAIGEIRSLYAELPFARRIPIIDRSTPIVSAGSCFASEIAHALQRDGYNYIVKEQNKDKDGSYELKDAPVLPASSAAWGIIFNTPSFRQLVEKAFGVRSLPKILWSLDDGDLKKYFDPFREELVFASPEAFEQNYDAHIEAARAAFLEMRVFIITLGLNEIWRFKADGSVFSRSPWRTAPLLVEHRVLTVDENVNDLVGMTDLLRLHNPEVKIICSLSPIPLHATFRADDYHVVTANAHSKAVLRVAAEKFASMRPNVYYFPSYEVVTSCVAQPWERDQRHVTPEAVSRVMDLFHKMYVK